MEWILQILRDPALSGLGALATIVALLLSCRKYFARRGRAKGNGGRGNREFPAETGTASVDTPLPVRGMWVPGFLAITLAWLTLESVFLYWIYATHIEGRPFDVYDEMIRIGFFLMAATPFVVSSLLLPVFYMIEERIQTQSGKHALQAFQGVLATNCIVAVIALLVVFIAL